MILNDIINNGMVLQANKPILIGGSGSGIITINFCGRKYNKKISDSEKDAWSIELESMDYGGPYEMTIELNGVIRIIKDIMIGEVYICAGQSNMQFTIANENNPPEFCDNDMVRCFVQDRKEDYEGFKKNDGWCCLKKDNAKYWSSIGLNLALCMYKKLNVAIGIIGLYQGASNIQTWIGEKWLDKEVELPIDQRHSDILTYPLWNDDSFLYNYTFKKILPYSSSCVVWYQGESNTSQSEADIYDKLLTRLVSCWRSDLLDDNLLFLIIELCDFNTRDDKPWKDLQKKQSDVAKYIPNTICVKGKDILEHDDIHPQHKELLAERISEVIVKLKSKK